MKKRIVVTGLGMVTPLGTGVEKSWEAICNGKSGIDRITRFDTSEFKTKIAGEVKDFCAEDYIPKKDIKKMCIFIHYALAASLMAQKDASLEINDNNADSVGVIIGSGLGGLPTIEEYCKIYLEKGPSKISPFFTTRAIINLAAGQVSIYSGAKGPNVSIVTACASGTHSIGDAFKIIQRGDAKVMIAGGAESTLTPLGVGGFSAMKALSTRNDAPSKASRPFERDRDGFIMGEGAGILIVEELEYALNRGARIYAEIIGYGLTGDAYHVTSPSPNGEGAARCIKMALDDAEISPSEVDYINAHGTSTKFNDLYETIAIKSVFGDYAYKLPVSSTKSMTGHLLGAAGAVEAIFTILSIRDGIMPPTINYDNPDPECDLDYVPNQARRKNLNTVLSNSFGFGGTNAAIVFRKYEE